MLRHLVVVVPGIGGSVLRTIGDGTAFDATIPGVARTLVDPARLSLDRHPVLNPVGLVRGVTVMDGLTILPGYDSLVQQLGNQFGAVPALLSPSQLPPPGSDLLLFPYDFRLGVAASAERLATALHPLVGSDQALWPGRPVLLVGHSMGGLVARMWIGQHGGWRHCAALITLGTPHRGAPKALDWLVNGVRWHRRWQTATDVIRDWPGVWDLIPRYDAVYHQDVACSLRPEDLPDSCIALTSKIAGTSGRTGSAGPAGADRSAAVTAGLRAGAATHTAIAAGWSDIPAGRAPKLHAVFASRHGTPSRAVLAGGRLTVSKADPQWLKTQGWEGGDGTVPAFCAVPVDLSEDVQVRVPVWDRHGPLGCSPAAAALIREYERGDISMIRGEHDPAITLDLDDFALADRPLPVKAAIRNAHAAPGRVMTVRTRPVDAGHGPHRQWDTPTTMTEVEVEESGATVWGAVLPPRPAGTYEVQVIGSGMPQASPPPVAELLHLHNPDDDRTDSENDPAVGGTEVKG